MEYLSDYLNDHLAGSIGARELLDRLIEACVGKPLERFFRDLRREIEEDQEQLEELMAKLGVSESSVRKAGAWLAEKLSRAKIDLGEREEMGIFLALEALHLGISGKRSLWRALQAASRTMPELARLDYSGLEKRAIEQCERVEARRLEIARAVFQAH
jgi:ABC-type hemin transport system ATPase subunit